MLYSSWSVAVVGLQPAEVFEDTFTPKYRDRDTGLTLIEQLYTARGSQGGGLYYE